MRLILTLLLLAVSTPALAFQTFTGTFILTSCPTTTCTVSGTGQTQEVDGAPDNSLFCSAYALAEVSIPATGSCVNNGPLAHRFRVYQSGATIFEDQNATFNVTRVNNCATQITVTGTYPVAYSVVMDNPHVDEFNRLAFDMVFTSSVGIVIVGGNGETEPPVVRH